jgi:hypothetical protein
MPISFRCSLHDLDCISIPATMICTRNTRALRLFALVYLFSCFGAASLALERTTGQLDETFPIGHHGRALPDVLIWLRGASSLLVSFYVRLDHQITFAAPSVNETWSLITATQGPCTFGLEHGAFVSIPSIYGGEIDVAPPQQLLNVTCG